MLKNKKLKSAEKEIVRIHPESIRESIKINSNIKIKKKKLN